MSTETDLAEFLERASNLDVTALLELTARHRSVGERALARSRASAHAVAERTGKADALADLAARVVVWAGSGGAVPGAWAGIATMDPIVLVDARRQAAPALVDVATALLLGDAIGEDDRRALGAGWPDDGEWIRGRSPRRPDPRRRDPPSGARSVADLVEPSAIERLTGPTSFAVGSDLARDDDVRLVEFGPLRVVAEVADGGGLATVELSSASGALEWSCTCAEGADGTPCRHFAASAIVAWQSAPE